MKKILLLVFLAIIIVMVSARRSSDDCNLTFYKGISYDGRGRILVAGKLSKNKDIGENSADDVEDIKKEDKNQFLPAIYQIQIGRNDSISKKFDIHGEVLNGGGSESFKIHSFYGYLRMSNVYYFLMNQAGAPVFSILSATNSTIKPIFNIHNTPFVPSIREQGKNSSTFIYSAYGLYKLNKLPTDKQDSKQAVLLYRDIIINGLSFDSSSNNDNSSSNNTIYMSTYEGKFLKGNTDCLNCSKDQLEFIGNDTSASSLTDFLVAGDMLFYSFSGGIKAISKLGGGFPIQLVSGENVKSMIQVFDSLYFQNEDGQIKTLRLQQNLTAPSLVFNPNNYHKCF